MPAETGNGNGLSALMALKKAENHLKEPAFSPLFAFH